MAEDQQRIFRKSIMPKISVIVPVYKAEQYICRCVDSILAQTFTDFELLLIDDGSPDNSGAICDEYAAKDSRIKVFHKENGGVSSARNLGLDNATGEWVYLADADDFLEIELFKECSKYFKCHEIIRFCSFSVNTFGKKKGIMKDRIHCDKIIDFQKNTVARTLIIPVWCAIIKSDLVNKNNIRFNSEIRNGEDWLFFFDCVMVAKSAIQLQYIGYNYTVGDSNACSTNLSADKIIESYKAYEYIKDAVKQKYSFDFFVKLGYINLLNYSVLRVIDTGKSIREVLNYKSKISKYFYFGVKEAKFCFKHYLKFSAIQNLLFFSNVLIYLEIIFFKIKNYFRLLKSLLSNA